MLTKFGYGWWGDRGDGGVLPPQPGAQPKANGRSCTAVCRRAGPWMKVGRCGNGLAVARITGLYGIPITQPRPPSRIPMRSVTRTSRIKGADGLGVLDASQGRAGPTAIHCTPLNRLSLGASTCWTFSWSPSRSFSSRYRSATRSLAIGSEEACHDLRLFARRPRDRGADDLPRLRAAQARAALKGSRP